MPSAGSVSEVGAERSRRTALLRVRTSAGVGGRSYLTPCDTRAAKTEVRRATGFVITMSAKVLKSGWYGQVLGETRWHEGPTKTGSDLHR